LAPSPVTKKKFFNNLDNQENELERVRDDSRKLVDEEIDKMADRLKEVSIF